MTLEDLRTIIMLCAKHLKVCHLFRLRAVAKALIPSLARLYNEKGCRSVARGHAPLYDFMFYDRSPPAEGTSLALIRGVGRYYPRAHSETFARVRDAIHLLYLWRPGLIEYIRDRPGNDVYLTGKWPYEIARLLRHHAPINLAQISGAHIEYDPSLHQIIINNWPKCPLRGVSRNPSPIVMCPAADIFAREWARELAPQLCPHTIDLMTQGDLVEYSHRGKITFIPRSPKTRMAAMALRIIDWKQIVHYVVGPIKNVSTWIHATCEAMGYHDAAAELMLTFIDFMQSVVDEEKKELVRLLEVKKQ